MKEEEAKHYAELSARLLGEQKFSIAVIAGVVAMILGAAIYAVVALALAGESVSVVAVVVGLFIGYAMQFLGRGVSAKFAITAAVLALCGCVLAKLFTIALYTLKVQQFSPAMLFRGEQIAEMWRWSISGLDFLDFVFWVTSIGTAAFLAKRRLTRDEDLAMHTYRRNR